MSVANYILATLGLLASLTGCGFALLIAFIDEFVPTPTVRTAEASKGGCAWLIFALLVAAWFAGVLLSGQWGWLL